MFNVMVSTGGNCWEEGSYVWHKSRILEHTDDPIKELLGSLDPEALEELARLPTLFMYEHGTEGSPKVGWIKRIQRRGPEFRVIFELDPTLPALTEEQIEALAWDLSLNAAEFTRTHWAVKEGDLLEILGGAGVQPFAAEGEAAGPEPAEEIQAAPTIMISKVFVVHGRDNAARDGVARFLSERVGLQPVILSERPNQGRYLLTKFEEEADGATYAVVLLTGDDLGRLRPGLMAHGAAAAEDELRARQNVIFELGFFVAKLGIDRVCVLHQPGTVKPTDFDGIAYVPFDENEGWQRKLITELHAANLPVSSEWWKVED